MAVPGTNPTILVPGFFGGNALFRSFRALLRSRGVDAECWNRSPLLYRRRIDWYGGRLAEDLVRLRANRESPLTGVGWSEGGLIFLSAMRHLSRMVRDPENIVRRVISFATPYDGTWAARSGVVFDRPLKLNIREMRPGSPELAALVEFLHRPRRWEFLAVGGTNDAIVRAPQECLDPAWCHYGPWDHSSLLWHPGLFDLIHKLIAQP